MVQLPPLRRVFPVRTQLLPIKTEEISSHALRIGLANWQMVRLGRRFPARDDIKLRNIAGALHNAAMIRVLDDGADYECCVLGDAVTYAYSVVLQGRKVSDVEYDAPSFGNRIHTLLDQVMATKCPVAMRRIAGRDFPEAKSPNAEAVLLPLGPGETRIDHILAFVSFDPDPQ